MPQMIGTPARHTAKVFEGHWRGLYIGVTVQYRVTFTMCGSIWGGEERRSRGRGAGAGDLQERLDHRPYELFGGEQ
jgi:hypothetical protein